jgi:hypothetical protein
MRLCQYCAYAEGKGWADSPRIRIPSGTGAGRRSEQRSMQISGDILDGKGHCATTPKLLRLKDQLSQGELETFIWGGAYKHGEQICCALQLTLDTQWRDTYNWHKNGGAFFRRQYRFTALHVVYALNTGSGYLQLFMRRRDTIVDL